MNRHHHKIIPLKLGMTNCYLIRGGQDFVMVDAGPPNSLEKFRRKLEQLGINPSTIKPMVNKTIGPVPVDLCLDDRRIYPSHGKQFDAAVFKKYLNS